MSRITVSARRLVLSGIVAISMAVALAGPAAAHAPCTEANMPGHSEFGRLHIATHGPHGHGVGGHNPGTHRGFSACTPSGR